MTTTTPVSEPTLLPTPCRENHASFLAVLPDGSLGCAWFGGSREGRPDVSIYFSRWTGEEAGWSEPVQVSHDQERSEQNPVIVVQDDGALWLLYTSQELGSQDTSVVKGQRSSDLGATWSAAETVLGQPGTFIRQGLVVGQDGSWRLPIFHCGQVPGRPWTGDSDTSAVAVSTDRGASWSEHPVPDSLGEVHMALVPLRDGTTAAFFRSRWADAVHRSTSTDGITFTAPEPVDVPNGNVSISVLRVPETDLLVMACNPVAAAEGASYLERTDEDEEGKAVAPGQRQELDRYAVWTAPRVPLALFSSRDGGLTWRREVDIAGPEGIGPGERRPEMSYPSLVVDTAGDLHVSWSHHRIGIGWARVPAAQLSAWADATD